MRKLTTVARETERTQPKFFSVAETARILGVSDMTLYRAIRTGHFPAVQLMGRLIIPAKVIDEMIDVAIEGGAAVSTDAWTVDDRQAVSPNDLYAPRSGTVDLNAMVPAARPRRRT